MYQSPQEKKEDMYHRKRRCTCTTGKEGRHVPQSCTTGKEDICHSHVPQEKKENMYHGKRHVPQEKKEDMYYRKTRKTCNTCTTGKQGRHVTHVPQEKNEDMYHRKRRKTVMYHSTTGKEGEGCKAHQVPPTPSLSLLFSLLL